MTRTAVDRAERARLHYPRSAPTLPQARTPTSPRSHNGERDASVATNVIASVTSFRAWTHARREPLPSTADREATAVPHAATRPFRGVVAGSVDFTANACVRYHAKPALPAKMPEVTSHPRPDRCTPSCRSLEPRSPTNPPERSSAHARSTAPDSRSWDSRARRSR